jgi:NADPH2:quinone reductase
MQAIILTNHGGTENFRLTEIPIPTLRPGEVRIRVKSIAFNPVDCQIRRGMAESRQVRSPVLGRDLSGVIDAVHAGVADFAVGDEVYSYVANLASNGTYAEYVSVPAELVCRKPRSLTHDQAAAVPVAGITARLALQKVHANAAKSLFIAGGAGGVGSFAVLFARQQLGIASLFASAGGSPSRTYLRDECLLDEDHIIDYRSETFISQALERNGAPFDCVIDLVGGSMLSACCKLLGVDGRLASVTEAPSALDFDFLFQRNATFAAVGANAYSLQCDRAGWRNYQLMLTRIAALFDCGALRPPKVTNVGLLSVESVIRAHALLEKSSVQGKLVMSCAAEERCFALHSSARSFATLAAVKSDPLTPNRAVT